MLKVLCLFQLSRGDGKHEKWRRWGRYEENWWRKQSRGNFHHSASLAFLTLGLNSMRAPLPVTTRLTSLTPSASRRGLFSLCKLGSIIHLFGFQHFLKYSLVVAWRMGRWWASSRWWEVMRISSGSILWSKKTQPMQDSSYRQGVFICIHTREDNWWFHSRPPRPDFQATQERLTRMGEREARGGREQFARVITQKKSLLYNKMP